MSNARENVNLLTSADWNIATLRLANWGSGAVPPQVVLKTNYVAGDGGGLFRYDSTDTTTADNGGTVIVDAAGNRWKRQYSSAAFPSWFGATGSGTETSVIQSALSSAAVIEIPNLVQYSTAPLTSTSNIITWPAGSYTVTPNNSNPIVISNLSPAPQLTFTNATNHSYSRIFGNLTANNIYNAIFPSINSFDVSNAVLQVVSGSTIEHATAVAGYFRNNAVSPTNAVALFGCGLVTTDGGAGWGVNTLLQDAATRTAGTGTSRILVGAEFDFNVMNAGTSIIGVSVGGNSLAQPANANAFICNTLGGGFVWTTAFASFDGCATNGLVLGAVATSGASVNSQNMLLTYFTSGGVKQNVVIKVESGGYLTFTGTTPPLGYSFQGASLFLDSGKTVSIGGQTIITNRVSGYAAMTGTADKGTVYDTATVTLAQLAGRVMQLQNDLTNAHGLIGV